MTVMRQAGRKGLAGDYVVQQRNPTMSSHRPRHAARGTAAVLIAYGALVIGYPRALPTLPVGGGMVPAGAGMGMQMDMPGHEGAARPSSP